MKIPILSLTVLSSLISATCSIQAPPILDERIMEISRVSAKLASLAYQVNAEEQYEVITAEEDNGGGDATTYAHPELDYIHFYTNEPDQAIVARKDGRCYIAFRGTEINAEDWEQNIDPGDRLIYRDGDTSQPSCESRRGFGDFLQKAEVTFGTNDTLSCVATCKDPDDCLVITGHSQGGATAVIASILLYSHKPTLVTFGQPPAVDPDCPWVPSERFYRYVNSKVEDGEDDDLAFDVVPFSPSIISGSVHYGYMLLLGDDPQVKYLGFDEDYDFQPDLWDLGLSVHTMQAADAVYSYESRINALINTGTFPVPVDGFSDGSTCERGYRELCQSVWCVDNICKASIKELCVKGSCENNYECESGYCIWDSCAPGPGMVADGCPCQRNGNCVSGDCDTSFTSFDWTCAPSDVSADTPEPSDGAEPQSPEPSDSVKPQTIDDTSGACTTSLGRVVLASLLASSSIMHFCFNYCSSL